MSLVYRGFEYDKLVTVLTTGLDYPAPAAFFGSVYVSKAWEYPASRDVAAVMIYERSCLEPSWTWSEDRVRTSHYPRSYRDAGREIHTRFSQGRGTFTFADEEMYGFFVQTLAMHSAGSCLVARDLTATGLFQLYRGWSSIRFRR